MVQGPAPPPGGAVLCVSHSPDGSLLASAGQNGRIQVLDVFNSENVHELVAADAQAIGSVCFSPRGGLLAAAERKTAKIRLWGLQSGVEVRCLSCDKFGGVNAVSFSREGTTIVAAYGNVLPSDHVTPRGGAKGSDVTPNALMVWDVEAGTQRMQIANGHGGAVTTVACSPASQRYAASGSIDGTIRLWDVTDGKEAEIYTGHTAAVWAVSYTPDGALIASASSDKTVRLWSVGTRAGLLVIKGHTKVVTSVQATSDGSKLLSCSSDSTVKLWDITSGEELACAEGDGAFTAVSVGADFNVAVGCSTGELYLLDMSEAADAAAAATGTSPARSVRSRESAGGSLGRAMLGSGAGEIEGLWKCVEATAVEEMDRISREKGEMQREAARELERSSAMGLAELRRRLEAQHKEEIARVRQETEREIRKMEEEAKEERKRMKQTLMEQVQRDASEAMARKKAEQDTHTKTAMDNLLSDSVRQTSDMREAADAKIAEVKRSCDEAVRLAEADAERRVREAKAKGEGEVKAEEERAGREAEQARKEADEKVERERGDQEGRQREQVERLEREAREAREAAARGAKEGVEQLERERKAEVTKAQHAKDEAVLAAFKDRDDAVAAALKDRDAAVDAARGERDAAVAAAVGERDAAVAAARSERDAAVAAAEKERDEAVAGARAEAEKETKEHVEMRQAEAEAAKAAADAELEANKAEVAAFLAAQKLALEKEEREGKEHVAQVEAQMRVSLKAELDKVMSKAAADHEREREIELAKLKVSEVASTAKALEEEERAGAERRLRAMEHARVRLSEELKRDLEVEVARLREVDGVEKQGRFEAEREALRAQEEVELQAAMALWRDEGARRVAVQAQRAQEHLQACASPGAAEYCEVFSDGSGARHVASTMQLIRNWASLGLDEDGAVAEAYAEFAEGQRVALRGVRELYVAQLQKMAELLMTRSPPAPDELLDIIEGSMKHVLTMHKHASGLAPEDGLVSERERLETDEWISTVARDEVEATAASNRRLIVVQSGDEGETDEDEGGMRSIAEELVDERAPSVRGMIHAIRHTPNQSLAGAVGMVRRELASGMAEVLMDDPLYAKELANGMGCRGSRSSVTPQGTPRHWQERGGAGEGGSDRMRGEGGSDRMRRTMTEKFRHLEPDPTAYRPEYKYSTPQRAQQQQQQQQHEADHDASSRTEPRVQVPFWMRHHRAPPPSEESPRAPRARPGDEQHSVVSMKHAASHSKREKHIVVGGGIVRTRPRGMSPPQGTRASAPLGELVILSDAAEVPRTVHGASRRVQEPPRPYDDAPYGGRQYAAPKLHVGPSWDAF